MKAKALVLEKLHKPLFYKDIELMESSGLELVELKAAALNRRDYWITKGLYPGIHLPAILGSDGSGIWKGKKVLLNPNVEWGNADMPSSSYRILGLEDKGCFSTKILIPKSRIHEIPDHLNYKQAAALPLAGLTAYRALFSKARVKSTDKVLITGIGGGVALFLCQFALAIGATVFVNSGSSEKITKAKQLGVSNGVLYSAPDWDKQLKAETSGFDLIIDGAGGPDFTKLIRLCKPGGKIVMYGGTAGVIDHILPAHVFLKQIQILGTTMGSDLEFQKMLEFVSENKIIPIIDSELKLKDGNKALQRMAFSKQFGKIILLMN